MENKTAKLLLIIVNVLIWGYAVFFEILPLIFNEDSTSKTIVKKNNKDPRVVSHKKGGRRGRKPSFVRKKSWKVKQPLRFFASARDPFVPFLIPKGASSFVSVKKRNPKRVINYKIPDGNKVTKKSVSVVYRLSSIMKISKKNKVIAIVTSGSGYNRQSLTIVAGQRLPDGSMVTKIDFKNQTVIVEKKRHVFKLVDHSPWVYLIKRP